MRKFKNYIGVISILGQKVYKNFVIYFIRDGFKPVSLAT